ncbi:hypothetical protein PO909_013712, partial [Leuciscus waleckii]
ITVKPGVCPNTKYEAEVCARIRFVSCAVDRDCANNEKCCNNGCGLQCMAPVIAVKHGMCPIPDYKGVVCNMKRPVRCANDTDCADNKKCCSTTCGGRECMAPVTVKPGVCPIISERGCDVKPIVMCAEDSDCADNKKCCKTTCDGRQCRAPVTVKCPRRKYEAAMCPRIRFVSCADDRDCANNEKCCSNGCGLQCMAPVTAKPGVCPSTEHPFTLQFCTAIMFEQCADDSDCADNQKCCDAICGGRGCTAPVAAKPGVCPSRKSKPGMCPLMHFMSCVDDSDCANNEKCCSNGCGLDCMAPV